MLVSPIGSSIFSPNHSSKTLLIQPIPSFPTLKWSLVEKVETAEMPTLPMSSRTFLTAFTTFVASCQVGSLRRNFPSSIAHSVPSSPENFSRRSWTIPSMQLGIATSNLTILPSTSLDLDMVSTSFRRFTSVNVICQISFYIFKILTASS